MPSDRDRELAAQCWCAPSTSRIEMDARLAGVVSEAIAQARAEGYRDGIERAIERCKVEHLFKPSGAEDAAYDSAVDDCMTAIRALAPVPDSHPIMETMREIGALPGIQEALAKATDPRGSALSGGGDATEVGSLRKALADESATGRRLVAQLERWFDATERVLTETFELSPGEREQIMQRIRALLAPEPSTPPLDRTPPAGAPLSPAILVSSFTLLSPVSIIGRPDGGIGLFCPRCVGSSQPERTGGEGADRG